MNDYRPDWIGAIGAGISVLIALAIAKGVTRRRRNQTLYYVVLVSCTVVFSLAIREALRYFGV